jgi:dynein heavy chain 2, cytosolic
MLVLETKAGKRLQAIFNALRSQPNQLLREFQKYSSLLHRRTISRQLEAEVEILLTQLVSSLNGIQFNLKERSYETHDQKGRNMTRVVNGIVWARQNLNKISELDNMVKTLGGQKAAYESLSLSLYDDLRRFEREQFEFWVEVEVILNQDTQRVMDDYDGQLTLKRSGRLMEIDFTSGKLVVNYGDHLVTLLREVRQLLAMGFAVPASIQNIAELGQKYFRHGVILKQVANFYNTIDQQMYDFQNSMLLAQALNFERIVKNSKGPSEAKADATWDNPKELELFISKLQKSADSLTSENRKLRKYHGIIVDHVIKLMNTDLIRNQSKWKEIINVIKMTINSAFENGMSHESTLAWRNHIDYQLYKSLEFQYKVSLEDLHEQLPKIKIDLVFKQQRLQFRPTFEGNPSSNPKK